MNWVRVNYFPNMIKRHFTTQDLYEKVVDSISQEYKTLPSEIDINCNTLLIDPGGIMINDDNYLSTIIDELSISIKPEHILLSSSVWNVKKHIFNLNNEKIFRVYLNDMETLVITESLHSKIGAWLASIYSNGILSRAEIKEKVGDFVHLYDSTKSIEAD